MTYFKILTIIFATALVTECKRVHYQKRETTPSICDQDLQSTSRVHCFCIRYNREDNIVRSADCYLTRNGTNITDDAWNDFQSIKSVEKLLLTNPRGVPLSYIPTPALKHLNNLHNINFKYGDIKEIIPYAFGNLTKVQEIILSDNQIEILHRHAFYHHSELTTITLDTNKITEVNREVFGELPVLEKLFLTNNKITTLHDKAFIHLTSLKELELDENSIFSLNSDTFSGLSNLDRLELSGNNLEVIGDNTFLPLVNLRSLNLGSNKIQMLDDKAFKGLSKLRLLSLARNKLTELESVGIFQELQSLISLNLKSNKIVSFKEEVMAPIIHNFYVASCSFDFDENEFPCNCKLDWLLAFKNKTENPNLRLAIENIKCVPDADLNERWKKLEDADKANAPDEDLTQSQNVGDYEYYDETQLGGGKLFYTDVRELLHCPNNITLYPQTSGKSIDTRIVPQATSRTPKHTTELPSRAPKMTPPPMTNSSAKPKETNITNHGVLDLFEDEKREIPTTSVKPEIQAIGKERTTATKRSHVLNEVRTESEKSKHAFTTSRLATVSAKPAAEDKRDDVKDMASDQAIPPNANRRTGYGTEVQEIKKSNANINTACLSLVFSIFIACFRLM